MTSTSCDLGSVDSCGVATLAEFQVLGRGLLYAKIGPQSAIPNIRDPQWRQA